MKTIFAQQTGHRKQILNTLCYLMVTSYTLLAFFPILWMFLTSMKDNEEVYALPPVWFPRFSFQNYVKVFADRPFLFYMKNSFLIALSVTLLCVFFGTMAGYGFSRDRAKISAYLFWGVLTTRAIPPIALIVPFIILANDIGLFDTLRVMIIAGLFLWLPFVTWLMRGYFDGIPSSLLEAALMDGCSQFQAFWKVMLPLAKPGLISSAILTFIYTWNEYLYALALTRMDARTLPVGLTDFFLDDTILWNQLSGGTMIAILPPILFVVLLQRFIVRGILEGAVKG